MKIYKIAEASEYLGVPINVLRTLTNNAVVKSFKTPGGHKRFRQEDLDAYLELKRREKMLDGNSEALDRHMREEAERTRLIVDTTDEAVATLSEAVTHMRRIVQDVEDEHGVFISLQYVFDVAVNTVKDDEDLK